MASSYLVVASRRLTARYLVLYCNAVLGDAVMPGPCSAPEGRASVPGPHDAWTYARKASSRIGRKGIALIKRCMSPPEAWCVIDNILGWFFYFYFLAIAD